MHGKLNLATTPLVLAEPLVLMSGHDKVSTVLSLFFGIYWMFNTL